MLTVCAFALCRSRGMPRGLARARAPIRLIYYTISRKFASVCRKVTENARYHFEDSAADNASERLEIRAASPRYNRSAATLRPAKIPLTAALFRLVRRTFAPNACMLFAAARLKSIKNGRLSASRTLSNKLNRHRWRRSCSSSSSTWCIHKPSRSCRSR